MRSGCTVSGRMAIIELLMKQNIQEDQVDCTSRTAFAHTQHKKRTGGSEMRGSVTVNHASLLKSHQYSDESTSKPKRVLQPGDCTRETLGQPHLRLLLFPF